MQTAVLKGRNVSWQVCLKLFLVALLATGIDTKERDGFFPPVMMAFFSFPVTSSIRSGKDFCQNCRGWGT